MSRRTTYETPVVLEHDFKVGDRVVVRRNVAGAGRKGTIETFDHNNYPLIRFDPQPQDSLFTGRARYHSDNIHHLDPLEILAEAAEEILDG